MVDGALGMRWERAVQRVEQVPRIWEEIVGVRYLNTVD